ncbi:MAG: 4-hydroxy-3-methylbut-2-enyl diphosphate reductase [Phycisphaerales bacterium]|jgi:4-hydroxy-3-methylbut-2-enyl diphosphate reductase|nr:4-hydroxy-3-methylbut-2-enyl diphosphate reductase [Phycisphaerales bacterium]
MRIMLANPRGFCAGVHMAVDIVDQLLDVISEDEQLYVFHEIVHNRHVVDRLRTKGAIFVESIEAIPEGSTVVFSAHGVSPTIRAQANARNLTAIDATCPLVTKVHNEAIRYADRNWQILLIGHKNHQEILGTAGEAPNHIQIVESPADIEKLHIIDPNKLVYLTQTTLSTDDADVIIAALKKAFPTIQSPPTDDICYATTNRQQIIREQASIADVVLVVGSQNSSNSLRLTEIAESAGTKAHLLDDVTHLQKDWLQHANTVLVTAGASAPEHLVGEIVQQLIHEYDGVLEPSEPFNENMTFSMPVSLQNFLERRDVTIRGEQQ